MSSKLRFLHANGANPYLDCYCGNRPVCRQQPFHSCSEYYDIDYGGYSVLICKPNCYEPIINGYTYLPENSCQTIVTTGSSQAELFITPDGIQNCASQNKAYIRFINLAWEFPCLDFRFTDGLVAIAQNIRYQSITEYYPLNAGNYKMDAFVCDSNRLVLTVPRILLKANYMYSFYMTNQAQKPNCHYLLCVDTCSQLNTCSNSTYPNNCYFNSCNASSCNSCYNSSCYEYSDWDFHNYAPNCTFPR